jgi:hypothetical protein
VFSKQEQTMYSCCYLGQYAYVFLTASKTMISMVEALCRKLCALSTVGTVGTEGSVGGERVKTVNLTSSYVGELFLLTVKLLEGDNDRRLNGSYITHDKQRVIKPKTNRIDKATQGENISVSVKIISVDDLLSFRIVRLFQK